MGNNIFGNENDAKMAAIDLFAIYKENKTSQHLKQYEEVWANLYNQMFDKIYLDADKKTRISGRYQDEQKSLQFFNDYTDYLLEKDKYSAVQEESILKLMKFYSEHIFNWNVDKTQKFYSFAVKYFANQHGLKIKFSFDAVDTYKNKGALVYYVTDDQTLYINAAKTNMYKNDIVNNVTLSLYEIIKTIESAYATKILKTEISPRAVRYMNEYVFMNTFGKAFSKKLIETPLMELETRGRVHSNFKQITEQLPVFLPFATRMMSSKPYMEHLNARHFVLEAKNYADSFIATMASKAIRGKPNSCPSNIKNYLFLNGQLKTIIQLDNQLQLAKEEYKKYQNDYTKQIYYDRLAINDYLFKRNNILKIQDLFQKLSKEMNPDYLQQLFYAQKHTKDDYDVAIVLLQDRLHELNTYAASNSTNVARYKHEIDLTKDLLAFAVSIPNKSLDDRILQYSLKANKFNLVDDKKMRYYQTLTGLGFGSAVAKIQKSINDSSEYILHNLTAEQAKLLKKQLAGRYSYNEIEIVPPLNEKPIKK